MSLIEFVVFIIAMLAMVILSAKVRSEKKKANLDSTMHGHKGIPEFRMRPPPMDAESFDEEDDWVEELDQVPPQAPSVPFSFYSNKQDEVGMGSDWESRTRVEDYYEENSFEHYVWNLDSHETPFQYGEVSGSHDLTSGELHPYALQQPLKPRIKKYFQNIPHTRDILIYHEIISPPKALRQDWDHLDELQRQTLIKEFSRPW